MKSEISIPSWFEETALSISYSLGLTASSLADAASKYVEAVGRDARFAIWLADKFPSIPTTTWRLLERVGRGQIDARLMNPGVPYGSRLRMLSVSDQKRALDGQIELLVRDGETLLVRIDSITSDQAEQLFARDHIRSLSEQRAFLESKSTKLRLMSDKTAPPVEVDRKRGRIVIGNVEITKSELIDYLRRLEG